MNRPSPALQVCGVSVSYGTNLALNRADLTVTGPGITALLGTNGAGKSTLFKAVLGLVRPTEGDVFVWGEPAARARARRLIAYVGQNADIDPDFPLTVADVVLQGRHGIGRRHSWGWHPRAHDHAAAQAALQRVGIDDLRGRPIGALSGGQRKRVFIARAIAQQARLLLLDEPFAGVDAGSEQEIVRLLRSLADGGATMLLATHDLESVSRYCDEAVLWQQRLVAQGTPREVLRPETLAEAFGLTPTQEMA